MQVLFAAALSLAAVGLLYAAWRDLLAGQWVVWAGWLLWLASCVFWVRANGAEFGTAIALTAPALVAWALVWSKASRREPRQRERRRRDANVLTETGRLSGQWRSISTHVLLFLVAVPLSFAAGALVSVGLTRLLPMSEVNAMVLAVMLTPVLWGAAAWWATAADHRLRATVGIVIGGLLGAAAAWL